MSNSVFRKKSIIAIGTFDGVHLGHRYLIRQAGLYRGKIASYGDAFGYDSLRCTALTFDRHPSSILRPGLEPLRLTGLSQKIDLLLNTGVDNVCVIKFDKQRSQLSAHDFIAEFLVKELNAAAVFVGENFRFGHQATGDTQLLAQMAEEMGVLFSIRSFAGG